MKGKILLADDDSTLLNFYSDALKPEFSIITALDGEEALNVLNSNVSDPFQVIISDYDMPKMNGIQFLTHAKQVSPDTVRIMLTSASDIQVAINALSEGSIFRFLNKPCTPNVLSKNIVAGIEQFNLITAEKTLLEKTLLGSIGIIMEILSIVNPEAFAQTLRIKNLVRKMLKRMKAENSWEIEVGVLLSQIGCVTVPAEIISKYFHNCNLTENEMQMLFSHPLSGHKIVSKIPRLENVAEGIKNQYKDYNPDKESTNLISDFIKILVDYDYLIHTGKLPRLSLEILHQRKEIYNPAVLQALEAEIFQVMEGFVVKSIKLEDLNVGMVLADDIRSDRNVILVRKDSEISDLILDRVLNYRHYEPIQEPIKVLEISK